MSTPSGRRRVPADLVEATPSRGGLGYWLLASPLILFLAWMWLDIVLYWSQLADWLAALVGLLVFVGAAILPLGYLAHRIVTSFPRLFQNAGWDVVALEPVPQAERYTVRYVPRERLRAPLSWSRIWLRVAQGWVYLEIAAIFVAAVLMIPLFFSAVEFGFGS